MERVLKPPGGADRTGRSARVTVGGTGGARPLELNATGRKRCRPVFGVTCRHQGPSSEHNGVFLLGAESSAASLTGFHGRAGADTCAPFEGTLVTEPGITLESYRAVGFERVVEGSIEPIQQPAANGGSQDATLSLLHLSAAGHP